jgi:hypothetical protein
MWTRIVQKDKFQLFPIEIQYQKDRWCIAFSIPQQEVNTINFLRNREKYSQTCIRQRTKSEAAEETSLKIVGLLKLYSECQELEGRLDGCLREVGENSPTIFLCSLQQAGRELLDFLTVTYMIKVPSRVLTEKITSFIQHLSTHVVELPVSRGYDLRMGRYLIIFQNLKYQEE